MRLAAVMAVAALWGSAADLEQARKFYDHTEYQKSIDLLKPIPQKDAAAYALLGQAYFMSGDYKQAAGALERAVAAEPRNADYVLWLARTYGRRAEMANPLSALGQASKARQYFENAVELNPRHIDALNDLLDFYLQAPGIAGGGMEKAERVVGMIGRVDAAEGQWAQAKLDEKRKEWNSAEQHLRRSVELGPQPGRFVALARLLAKRGRYEESDRELARAQQMAPSSPRLLYDRAEVYIDSNRNLGEAKSLLERYLACDITPDDPPKADARKLLRKIEAS
ncbi:MAG TPA: tetratricopeptide repeat protein [Bryobacteraceae bacterium]|nr:tetratricopeptide repeat protein [Bryobacteraceae bacterium]